MLPTHAADAPGNVQTFPQKPQFMTSLVTSTQPPSQSAVQGGHVPASPSIGMHAPRLIPGGRMQVSPAGHPQTSTLPQPSFSTPHVIGGMESQVSGTQRASTQRFPLQACPVGHGPQSQPPQPSMFVPHSPGAHTCGRQPMHTSGEPPHVSPAGQPHEMVPPHRSSITPHRRPTSSQVSGWQQALRKQTSPGANPEPHGAASDAVPESAPVALVHAATWSARNAPRRLRRGSVDSWRRVSPLRGRCRHGGDGTSTGRRDRPSEKRPAYSRRSLLG